MAEADTSPIPATHLEEIISLSDALPEELKKVLDELSPQVPRPWRQQATEAAYFIWSLDSGRNITDEQGQFLSEKRQRFQDQLANSGFVWQVYNRSSRWALDPTKSLPSWLYTREDLQGPEQLTEEDREAVDRFYQAYVSAHATERTTSDGQHYYDFTEGVPAKEGETLTGTHRSKGYVEDTQLQNVQNVESALEALRNQGIHPHTTKLFDQDRLVLYWNSKLSEEQKSQIEDAFDEHAVHVRAFAQDVPKVILTEDGYTVDVRASNDASLGEGGHNPFSWDEVEYNPGAFLRKYLQLTYWGCKDPTEPYKVSFIPVIVGDVAESDQRTERVVDLQRKIEDSDHLPTLVTERSYFDCMAGAGSS